jgi:glycosyltransferase involved in cell wall biosynthesis
MLAAGMAASRVVPNGVDLDQFKPADRMVARAQLGLPQDAYLLVATGVQMRSSQWKDYPTLRAAIAQAAAGLPGSELRCIVLGEETPTEDLGDAVIQFTSFQDNQQRIVQYYQAADAYLHPARADTFPTGVLEAMACGLPVIASAVGGIPEQVEEGFTGFLTEPGDSPSLAGRIVQLCADRELGKRLGAEGRERASRLFGLDQQVSAYLDWYAELLDNG